MADHGLDISYETAALGAEIRSFDLIANTLR
jgi:hypothetical protein